MSEGGSTTRSMAVPEPDDPGSGGEQRGDQIGPYRLLERIGEGGFGTVWLAERREPFVQRVALKIIKPGMDSRAVIARFEQERQALAVMDHPNVAKVLDGGVTPAGRPYFVMEHVKGEPITDYADRQKLTIRQRLELFIPVCEAVQHAHMKGIIHRDIKPSNVLVSAMMSDVGSGMSDVKQGGGSAHPTSEIPHATSGLVKVIDFGVAKAISHALTDKTIFTETGQLIGTPEYMSPEQAEMGAADVDTRTDVYSLGVLLYELLTGALPFDPETLRSKGYNEIQRVIREVDPPRPSTKLSAMRDEPDAQARGDERKSLARASVSSSDTIAARRRAALPDLICELKSELEWIPLKALRKNRNERYRSPTDLADDVRNYLAGRALIAGPESAAYRLRKFTKRHRGPVLAASAIAVVLIFGVVASSIGFYRAALNAAQYREVSKIADQRAHAAAAAEVEAIEAKKDAETQRDAALRARGEAEFRRDEARREAYVANIAAVESALAQSDIANAHRRLDACSAELRAWEWNYYCARTDESLLTLSGHAGSVRSAEFSTDGARIVTASDDGTARLWSADTGAEIAALKGHSARVNEAWFSPDGQAVVTASADGTARIWDGRTGALVRTLTGHTGSVNCARFSPDGSRIATGGADHTARLWDARTGRPVFVQGIHQAAVRACEFSADGSRLMTLSDDRTARVWDVLTGGKVADLFGHTGNVQAGGLSHDGALALTCAFERTPRLWKVNAPTNFMELSGHEGPVFFGELSPDDTRAVTVSWDGTARVWDTATGKSLLILRGQKPDMLVSHATFSPDGTRIATSSWDHLVRMWDAATGGEVATFVGHGRPVNTVRFSADGDRIVTASDDGTARVWDGLADDAVHAQRNGRRFATSFSPDGSRILTCSDDGTARIRDATTFDTLTVLRGHSGIVFEGQFNADGDRVITASNDSTARIWDARTGRHLLTLAHRDIVFGAGFSPDGRLALTACRDGTAIIWNATTGAQVATMDARAGHVWHAAFSPDGLRIVTSHVDRVAIVWDASTHSPISELRGHRGQVKCAEFSPDGTMIATASDDHTAILWRVAGASQMARLDGHDDIVLTIAFSPDGSRVVTSGIDRSVRLWDVGAGRQVAELRYRGYGLGSAEFSRDGSRILTACTMPSDRCGVLVWDARTYRERYAAVLEARRAKLDMRPVVADRFHARHAPEDVVEELLADASLDDRHRRAGLGLAWEESDKRQAAHERDRLKARELNEQAWGPVLHPGAPAEVIAKALTLARDAHDLNRDDANITNTLAVALYRVGIFDESLATLLKAEEQYAKSTNSSRHGSQPVDWAFIAMCHFRLGHAEEARAALAKLRELMQLDQFKSDEECKAFLHEAEALIEGKPSGGD